MTKQLPLPRMIGEGLGEIGPHTCPMSFPDHEILRLVALRHRYEGLSSDPLVLFDDDPDVCGMYNEVLRRFVETYFLIIGAFLPDLENQDRRRSWAVAMTNDFFEVNK